MALSSPRASLGALLLGLALAGCDGGLTAPGPDAAAPSAAASDGSAFAALLDAQLETATAEAAPSARALAAEANASLTFITGPTTITLPGFYLVTRNLNASADGIIVESDNVFLDLGGHTITGPGDTAGRGVVVEGARRVLVSGGTIRNFGTGVSLAGSSRVGVLGVRVRGNDRPADPPNGIPPQVGFLLVDTYASRLQGNAALEVNLGYFVRGGGSYQNQLTANTAEAGDFGLLGICYNPAPDDPDPAGPGPYQDRVKANFLTGFGTGIQISAGSAGNRFVSNRIYYRSAAWEDANGTNVFVGNSTMQL